MNTWRIVVGDALERLRELDAGSVQTCVTSPPYFGLRDYGTGSWEGGDEGCDHLMPPGGGTDASTLGPTGDGLGQAGVEQVTVQRRQQYRDCCGKCGATRTDSQLGLEATPDEYVARLVEVFRGVRRVLRDDGTLWLNLGDSYANNPSSAVNRNGLTGSLNDGKVDFPVREGTRGSQQRATLPQGIKPKDLLGIPWMVAFALRADGWYLRSDIIWAKPNPMPESVTDRPTKAHEYLFLLSKKRDYYFDADAIREQSDPDQEAHNQRYAREYEAHTDNVGNGAKQPGNVGSLGIHSRPGPGGRNKRSVWTVATAPFPGAHFAVFPPKLIEPCVLAGSAEDACGVCGAPWERVVERESRQDQQAWSGAGRENGCVAGGGHFGRTGQWSQKSETVDWRPSCDHQDKTGTSTVLDPFAGAGTTGLVATRLGRSFIGIELNSEYAEMARERIRDDAPLMNYLIEAS